MRRQPMLRIVRRGNKSDERGYTLLEYCAGAAIVLTIIWAALDTLGTNMNTLLTNISNWALSRAQDIENSNDNTDLTN